MEAASQKYFNSHSLLQNDFCVQGLAGSRCYFYDVETGWPVGNGQLTGGGYGPYWVIGSSAGASFDDERGAVLFLCGLPLQEGLAILCDSVKRGEDNRQGDNGTVQGEIGSSSCQRKTVQSAIIGGRGIIEGRYEPGIVIAAIAFIEVEEAYQAWFAAAQAHPHICLDPGRRLLGTPDPYFIDGALPEFAVGACTLPDSEVQALACCLGPKTFRKCANEDAIRI